MKIMKLIRSRSFNAMLIYFIDILEYWFPSSGKNNEDTVSGLREINI